ncbi:MAG TPA: biliverdin-producing heme oxygenase [Kofleriaceae bacterium]
MRLAERINAETSSFHAEADEDTIRLFGAITADDYRRYLMHTYGFVAPVERAIVQVTSAEHYVDLRRFNKQELIRRDLRALRVSEDTIKHLPQCRVPALANAEAVLGWAYVLERGTLGFGNLFRHLATVLPGEAAFASSYLKCYFGAVGEAWRSFLLALDAAGGHGDQHARDVIAAAIAAFRTYRAWCYTAERAVS